MQSVAASLRDQSWVVLSRRYATAVVSTAVAIWMRFILHPWLNQECPFSLFYLSVLLTAWIAGTGPAFLALGLGMFAASHFFIPPSSQKTSTYVPDLIVMDIGLPGMDGYEIARRLRHTPSTSRIKLIALTGWGGPADRELAKEAGFERHLIKPISFRELLTQIENLMYHQRGVARESETMLAE